MPGPILRPARAPTRWGAIYFGSTSVAMDEAMETLEEHGLHLDTLRVRAFPFADEVADFVRAHDQVFVVEQNRDAQLQKLLITECGLEPSRFIPLLHYDGTPITARFITGMIAGRMAAIRKDAAE